MSKVNLTVTFETITPLWTGDAWMENSVIRPSSLMGSLRFWFEVICYFGGVCKKEEFDKDKGRFEKDIENEKIKKKFLEFGTNFDGQVQALRSLNIPIPAIVFGTTGWRSLVEIKSIKPIEDYCFGNKFNLTDRFCINKKNQDHIEEGNNCPQRSNNEYSVFYFKTPYFGGKLEVVFEVEENIKDSIFLPLLTFMDRYGYWGGGWNIGYGRLRVLSVNEQDNEWKREEFDFGKFFNENRNIKIKIGCSNGNQENCIVRISSNYNDLFADIVSKNIVLVNAIIDDDNQIICNQKLEENIKKLIREKAKLRVSETNQKDRHYKFGKTGKIEDEVLPQGSKILPYINQLDNGSYQCGLLSIAGILSLYEQGEKNE